MAARGSPPPQVQGTAVLRLHGREVAHYVWQPDVPLATSPRPYLHPVRTLGGSVVTDAAPDSHPHQFGISIAAPDIDGRNFWGGRSFVAGHGPAWLDNHGIQRHQRWIRHTDTELAHQLRWIDPRQAELLRGGEALAVRGGEALAELAHAGMPGAVSGLDGLAARGVIRLWRPRCSPARACPTGG